MPQLPGGGTFLIDLFAAVLAGLMLAAPQLSRLLRTPARPARPSAFRFFVDRPG